MAMEGKTLPKSLQQEFELASRSILNYKALTISLRRWGLWQTFLAIVQSLVLEGRECVYDELHKLQCSSSAVGLVEEGLVERLKRAIKMLDDSLAQPTAQLT